MLLFSKCSNMLGKLFAFMHTEPMIIPDMVTMAKGINGAFIPLGCVAMRTKISDYFRTHPISVGSTYNSHPVGLASAYAAIKWRLISTCILYLPFKQP